MNEDEAGILGGLVGLGIPYGGNGFLAQADAEHVVENLVDLIGFGDAAIADFFVVNDGGRCCVHENDDGIFCASIDEGKWQGGGGADSDHDGSDAGPE